MKYVTIPEPVELPSGERYPFTLYLERLVNTALPFNSTAEGVRASQRIVDALNRTDPGHIIALEHADWRTLREVAERDGGPIPKLLPYLHALNEADDSVFEVKLPGHWVGPRHRGETVKMRACDVPPFWFKLLDVFEELGIDPAEVSAPPEKPTAWDHILLGTLVADD